MDDEIDDWLLDLIRQGDDRAFGLLYDKYYRRFLAFFLTWGFSREESKDLIQETFVRVYKGVGGFRGNAPLTSWLLRVARNVASNELRARKAIKRDGPEVSLDAMEAEEPGALDRRAAADGVERPKALDRLISQEEGDALKRAMKSLTDKQQQCLRLQMGHGMSMREIADTLGLAVGTVKATLFQARRKLEKLLKNDTSPADDDGGQDSKP